MYHSYRDPNEKPCDYSSESEDTSLYDLNLCPKCKHESLDIHNVQQCTCCQCKSQKNRVIKGKFGLAYVIETPTKKITKPTGWQVEFQDTPSGIVNNCEKMVKWVNCPPLGECIIPKVCGYPKACVKLLKESKKRDESPKCCSRVEENDQNRIQCPKQKQECACSKFNNTEHVCIICEQCKVKTSSSSLPKVLCCKKSNKKLQKGKYYSDSIPQTSNVYDDGTTYKNTRYYKESNKKDLEYRTDRYSGDLELNWFQNRQITNDLKCKYCNKEIYSDIYCSKCIESKLKTRNFQDGQTSNFKYKDEDDLDYIPKKEKKIKDTQTHYQKGECREDCESTMKKVINVSDKEVETKQENVVKPTVYKVDTKSVVAKEFVEKGVDVKSIELKSLFIEKKMGSNAHLKRYSNNNQTVPKERSHDSNKKLNITETKEKPVNNSGESIKLTNLKQPETYETDASEKADEEEVKNQLLEELEDKVIENTEENEKNVHPEKVSSDDFKILNYKNLPKNEIFTDNMTPMQKIKLALKIQKHEIQKLQK